MPNGPILIVDDEPTNLLALKEILEPDYRLMFAKTGVDALKLAKQTCPALVLLDIEMPGINGFEVCQRLRADPFTENVPVIFVTSRKETDFQLLGLELGGIDYISKPLHPQLVRLRVRNHLTMVRASQLERSHKDAIAMLGRAGHFNDNDTGVHIWRMAQYASVIARHAGWDDAACQLLELAAPMHDMGKIGIPNAILRKPASLNPAEWAVMKTHSQIGYDILSKSDAPVFELAAEISMGHHEKWDGSGYPNGLAGEAIAQSARIVAIADVFDALTMQRPYKKAWEVEHALERINADSGTHFDPKLVEVLNVCFPEILHIKEVWSRKDSGGETVEGEPQEGAAVPVSPRGIRSKTVLIVEDDEPTRETLRTEIAQSTGMNVITARDGKQGIEVIERMSAMPDFVLTDIYMPERDGFEVLNKLIAQKYSGDVLLMSSDPQMMQTARTVAQENGLIVKSCFMKPVSSRLIVQTIRH
jgi:putative two-component system response regulator|nr:response regulator [Rhodoferax sp.]